MTFRETIKKICFLSCKLADLRITAQCTHTAPRAPELIAASPVSACVHNSQPRHVSEAALRAAWLKSLVSCHHVEDGTKLRCSHKG